MDAADRRRRHRAGVVDVDRQAGAGQRRAAADRPLSCRPDPRGLRLDAPDHRRAIS